MIPLPTRIIGILIFTLFSTMAKSQFPLVASFGSNSDPNGKLRLHKMHTGYKFIGISVTSQTATEVFIYHLNQSLYKSFTIASYVNAFGSSSTPSIQYISEALFDNDESTVEYAITGFQPPEAYTIVRREDGTVLLSDSLRLYFDFPTTDFSSDGQASPVVCTDSGTLFIVGDYGNFHVYELPGNLTNCCCQSGSNDHTLSNYTVNSFKSESGKIFPNPASKNYEVKYQLPLGFTHGNLTLFDLSGNLVKSYKVGSHFQSIKLNSSELSVGTYIYKLESDSGEVWTERLIVID
jgi:hypothetical protein